ncbi:MULTISPECIES: hypothetical protein [Streptomyces]|uniref:Uncharacterized protein n=1 Tax=Streptomyces microflavus TaxID=1919 RepID=A0A6N9UZN9_STRMI|nr:MULTISPECIES: hypothetical protein [Streptomyces]MEE1728376.1 hypothetical protein [Streptomyces sp. BE282]NEB65994.1 hypothetical protein [Streptomyces microflavus]
MVTVHTDAYAVRRRQGRCGGYRVTEVNGQHDTSAADGTELYFHVSAGAADGKASLTTMMTTQVPVDRAFASASKGQAQTLAGSTESAITTDATANSVVKDAVPSALAFFAALLKAMAPARFCPVSRRGARVRGACSSSRLACRGPRLRDSARWPAEAFSRGGSEILNGRARV